MPVWHSERCNSMQETEIRKYAALMRELGLTGLEITQDDQKVRLERSVPAAPVQTAPTQTAAPAPETKGAGDYISVRSPIVGLFYAAPAENAQPYVSLGEPVKKGQVLCIVEAMKLMNEISAEEDGIISEICAANGQMVEYGTELFRIKR